MNAQGFLEGYMNKTAGWKTELAGQIVNPLNWHLGNLGGAAAALATDTKDKKGIAEADQDTWKNILVPGVASYNSTKRLGNAIRGPEITEAREALENELDEEDIDKKIAILEKLKGLKTVQA